MAATEKARSPNPVAGRFIGRERELGELCAGLDDAAAGHGRFFLVSGEPGIGKTRLVDELDAIARRQGARVWWARCWDDGGAPAYWPWAQLIRSYIAEGASDASLRRLAAADEVAALVPELRGAAHAESAALRDPARARFCALDALAGVFKSAAAERPLVLVIDDVHAADEPTLRMLSFLANDLRAARLLLIASFREAEIRQRSEVADVVAELERVGQRLPLRGWSATDIARSIADSAGQSPSAALVHSVHRATGGNPLFAAEVARLLTSARAVGQSDTTLAGLRLPERVREAVRQHLRSLSNQTVEVLSIAAVLGDEYDLDLLARVMAEAGAKGATRSRAHVLDWLREAIGAGLVSEVSPGTGRYRFAHGLLGGMLYDDLMPARRIELHRTAATVLAAQGSGNVAAVAHHLYHAAVGGDVPLAVDYQCRAGAQAMQAQAYERAAELYTRGLHLLDAHALADAARQSELLLALGAAQARGGAPAPARAAFERAALLARQCHDASALAGAALGASDLGLGVALPDRHDLCVGLLREAATALDEGDSSLRARVLARLSVAHPFGEPQAEEARVALAMARRLDDPRALAHVLIDVHRALWEAQHTAERLALAAEALRLAEQCNDLELIAAARTCEIPDLIELGDPLRLDQAIGELVRRADALRQPRYHWWATHYRSVRALARGDYAAAEQLAHDAESIGERLQDPSATSVLAVILFALRRVQGRADEVDPAVRAQVQQCPERMRCRCGLALAFSAVELQPTRAAERVDVALEQPPQAGEGDARVFRREGEFWTLSYADVTCRFKDSKGFAFIAHLLRHPGQDVHATALVASAGSEVDPGDIGREAAPATYLQGAEVRVGLGDAGELIDARAKAEYKQRLIDLREDLDDAEASGNGERAERVRDEIETLNRELCRAIGIGGRDRRAGSHAERARVNVTRAIGGVIKRIGERNPALAEHLAASIKTGTFCAYRPDRRESSWSMAG